MVYANIHWIYKLLEHVKGMNPRIQNIRISMTWDNNRLFKRSPMRVHYLGCSRNKGPGARLVTMVMNTCKLTRLKDKMCVSMDHTTASATRSISFILFFCCCCCLFLFLFYFFVLLGHWFSLFSGGDCKGRGWMQGDREINEITSWTAWCEIHKKQSIKEKEKIGRRNHLLLQSNKTKKTCIE